MTQTEQPLRLVVSSVSEDGIRLRPSDWIERFSTLQAEFGSDRRLRYSPHLHPMVIDGDRYLLLDGRLAGEAPSLYAQILAFIRDNHLQVHEETIAA